MAVGPAREGRDEGTALPLAAEHLEALLPPGSGPRHLILPAMANLCLPGTCLSVTAELGQHQASNPPPHTHTPRLAQGWSQGAASGTPVLLGALLWGQCPLTTPALWVPGSVGPPPDKMSPLLHYLQLHGLFLTQGRAATSPHLGWEGSPACPCPGGRLKDSPDKRPFQGFPEHLLRARPPDGA